jgi:hypothetical protein
VNKKIIRQFIIHTPKRAIVICPTAQPIDKNIGVPALDTSFIT